MIPILLQGSGDSLKDFRVGTPPTSILDISGVNDETIEIRPMHFFSYDDENYGLLYTSRTGSAQGDRIFKLATSPKIGFNHTWTKQGVVLEPTVSQWDDELGSATVTRHGDTWILIYCDFRDGQIGIATGTDLLNLTKLPENPVMNNSANVGAFNRYLRHPNINIIGDTVYCHYEGRELSAGAIIKSNLGYATASINDLTNWTIHPNILVNASDINYAKGKNDAVCNSNIIKIEDTYYWWFQAFPVQNDAEEFEYGGTSYAYSNDLINWTIVGTDNYHVYMGLFGYNGSNKYYATCQEVTPVWDGQKLCLYMWDLTDSSIGKIELDGEPFVNQFKGFDVSDNFNDGVIDSEKWATSTGNGITINESNGQINIVCDGVGSEPTEAIILESLFSRNNDDGNIICCFDLTRSTPTTGDYYSVEISSSDRNDGIRLLRSTTANKIDIHVYEDGVLALGRTFDFNGSDKFKIQLCERNRIRIFKGNGNVFEHLTTWNTSTLENIDFSFKVVASNSLGQTISIDNFAFGEYDSGLTETFII